MSTIDIASVREQVNQYSDAIISFLRELCAIPSIDSQIGPVGERAQAEMRKLGFDAVWFDSMGNTLGRIGDGPRILLYDSHIDTVGIGNRDDWDWDPFIGKIEKGRFYARGACDEKGSTPPMIYGLKIARDLGLLDGWTAYYFGNMEEWCDGIAPHALVEHEGIRPHYVVIGEPTKMQVYRGHKGRVEIEVTVRGRSAHAASNHLGDNAIYKALPIIEGVSKMEPQLGDDPFLGHGKITVTDMKVSTASINAVPDLVRLYIDRRLTFGESAEQAIAQVCALVPAHQLQSGEVTVEMMKYAEPSYTGFVFPVDKYFPAWALDEDHPLVQAGHEAARLIGLPDHPSGKWNFSTNGTYWMGKAGIPSIGFGPGEEETAHTVMDSVLLSDVVKAAEFYAVLPALIP
ncbi:MULTISPECIES: YgeY family selenium metabolism-linked hydrolase [Caldilinea]|jgi:putative selenium metabolism hydrolase|uniref:Putative hydrolase n=1 Tax=Caldilinea aerophila (strain DSM 14535 / JCM 11387 / NBRC 104270 / STL-6-O1) TaxID=926550 RepID=I0I3Y1_CALAS|nr:MULTISPECIES: YgeY family selenium metabolism-linked hydrolase [Caldilinea]BAL99968.1 putative hydrolase [Caldilinea aerophila DSM 14535 = NBRC 104270]GIV73363.1 MAG: selenium metabolism hydrolase [Caldilinea sp.]